MKHNLNMGRGKLALGQGGHWHPAHPSFYDFQLKCLILITKFSNILVVFKFFLSYFHWKDPFIHRWSIRSSIACFYSDSPGAIGSRHAALTCFSFKHIVQPTLRSGSKNPFDMWPVMSAPGQCPWWRPHPSRDISSWKRIAVADLNPWNCGCEDSRYLSCQVQRWPGFKKPTYWLQGRHSITCPCIILYPCLHSYYIHISYHHIIIISLNILSGSFQLGEACPRHLLVTLNLPFEFWVLSEVDVVICSTFPKESQACDSENIFA